MTSEWAWKQLNESTYVCEHWDRVVCLLYSVPAARLEEGEAFTRSWWLLATAKPGDRRHLPGLDLHMVSREAREEVFEALERLLVADDFEAGEE